ncbi:MAG: glycosyltransferase family 1 protein [Terracidiphilus sp.]|jgi:glycosyltransferase involved in cell wall biosynthesis
MKIAYDLRRIANPGIGRYMKTLVEATVEISPEHEYLLIMAPGTDHLLNTYSSVERIYARSRYYSISEQVELPMLLRNHGVDILHAPHFVVPVIKTCMTVATLHDAIHLVYPKDIASPVGRVYARRMIQIATKIADRVITVSEYSKADLIRLLGADPSKITVIPPFLQAEISTVTGRDEIDSVRKRYGISRDYILYMGIFKQRKNHVGLLKAFAELIRQNLDLELVISGPIEEGRTRLSKIAEDLNITDRLVFSGFVREEDMAALYSGAAVYACPSLYEGFGFTPLEAMACGVPVVCHNGTSLPEVCGEAALYSDARQPNQFAEALRRALEDSELRVRLTRLGYENARRFSTTRSAAATMKLYLEMHDSARKTSPAA